MRTELFDYALPERLIAVRPLAERTAARLMVLEHDGGVSHRTVADFPALVPEGALVVVNDTRVRNARVLGERAGSGGKVELLLLRPLSSDARGERWQALGRANKPLKSGARVVLPDFEAEVVALLGQGMLEICVRAEGGVESWLERAGHVPIPPYLRRVDEPADRERYQSVFSRRLGSVAAPTASLHFDAASLARLRARGVTLEPLTLEIGLGTFRPVTAVDLDAHVMHAETIEVGERVASAVAAARERGKPVIALGTTVVRALESAADPERPGHVRPARGETRLLIQPGYRFRVVDALLTNFHQPKSTLLALVCAFAGRERVLSAYRSALELEYRFLSYGDAMWLPRRAS